MTAWDGSLSTAVMDQISGRPRLSKATPSAARAASVAWPWCQACLASRQPTSTPPAPGTPSGSGLRPVNPMNVPVAATSRAQNPNPCRSKRVSIISITASLAARSSSAGATEVFMSAASPGVIDMFMPSRYYASVEEYLFALADAMKTEYDAIAAAGLVLQLDCPDLAARWARVTAGHELTLSEFRRDVGLRIDALNHATRDIPPEQLRLHLCWGNYEGPAQPGHPAGPHHRPGPGGPAVRGVVR